MTGAEVQRRAWERMQTVETVFSIGHVVVILGQVHLEERIQERPCVVTRRRQQARTWVYDTHTYTLECLGKPPMKYLSPRMAVCGDTAHYVRGHLHYTFTLEDGWKQLANLPSAEYGSYLTSMGRAVLYPGRDCDIVIYDVVSDDSSTEYMYSADGAETDTNGGGGVEGTLVDSNCGGMHSRLGSMHPVHNDGYNMRLVPLDSCSALQVQEMPSVDNDGKGCDIMFYLVHFDWSLDD
ncbi:hypothetical protein KIPB_006089 [Kipferlia bialata]|uniref:Uncharacterized protein n=1 Tax=Kipferlia bialata TaxID=797122 RepID=A0A9K3GJH3_9EUKA|nr:hypothetical protein KIPB_006089 [Kipferlia bialata]|eukprot:g6089.t1